VIPRFITQALTGEPLTVHGDGRASRDWLYVDDDAEAIEAIIETPIDRVGGEVLNVATGVDIPVVDIAELVLSLLGKPASLRVHVEERPGQVRRHIGSTDKIAELCGWRAGTSFEEGLARTVAWYRDNEPWWRGILARERQRPAHGVSSS
jgi:dTDP-glucose 4,6-dehydratase